ncbi:MAG: hypothetical protein AABY16_02910 [Nanoarchaeota archaeon]
MLFKLSRRGQIWIETVVYTLIGLALIGLVLAILTPKIKEFRDRSIIEQSIDSLNVIDSKINEILDAPGNKRKIELTIEKGKLAINASQNTIYFIIDESHSRYSEPGVSLQVGRINLTTKELTETYLINLELNYNYNLTFDGAMGDRPELVEFTPVSPPYKFFVENRGIQNNNLWIDISEG